MRALTSPKETSTLGRSQYIVDLVEVFIHVKLHSSDLSCGFDFFRFFSLILQQTKYTIYFTCNNNYPIIQY